MYVANAAILELRIFSQSQEDITSNYGFLLGLVKTFTVDTEKYYLRFYKVNDDKNCKNLVGSFYALCSQIICMYIAGWLIYLTRVLKNMLIQCYILSVLIRRIYQITFVRSFSFAKGQQTFRLNQSIKSQDHPRR